MLTELTWKVGGQQGEGIESAGEMLAIGLSRNGYHIYSYRQFSSRIKGGHTSSTVRVSLRPVRTLNGHIDILIAFDQETINVSAGELREGGLIIADSKFGPLVPNDCKATVVAIPFSDMAKQAGAVQSKNMVAVGAVGTILGLTFEQLEPLVQEVFQKKGDAMIKTNIQALQAGLASSQLENAHSPQFKLMPPVAKRRMLMTGNEAIALGALAGGARLLSAYPITPASDIMEYLVDKLPELGGLVIQTEDEIAACTMAIGANYAGVRAFTASSGPGLSLMTEAIGLAGMTETPVVIVNVQRGGPSTGLPTKHEQSDILSMLFSTHGEIPKVVMAPSTAEEAFYDMAEAFNLAEEYQCPVILLSDLQLSLAKQTVEPFEKEKVKIRRGKLAVQQDLPDLERPAYFARYAVTEDGISARTVPGMRNGIHCETGLEHDSFGRPTEASVGRTAQMDKRLGKLKQFPERFTEPLYIDAPHEQADLMVLGCGGTRGAISEAVLQLRTDGFCVNHAHIRLLEPFPATSLGSLLSHAKKIVVVENNATGQLAALLRMKTGKPVSSILHYDGSPFLPSQVYAKCREMM
ncbi:MAG: pyruvate flavodoxin/ferredoxin oxidoreductase domain protein [Anaerosporomusa subterranea]|jgi:2-oxoglutarate ferredoxin oxidoreductase subunit alpha|nr:pyruvate flavodoxin/ferredoxin oxidoreductase domain protein [Anaerosporomusa subterranea]